MSTTARGELHSMSYVLESGGYGVTPESPTMLPLRHNTCSLKPTRAVMQSAESAGDRMEQDTRMGSTGAAGDVNVDVCVEDHDNLIRMALNGNAFPAAVTLTATDISAAAADQSYNSVAAAFAFSAGDWVIVSGFTTAANNGIKRLLSAAAGKIVIDKGTALELEDAGDTVTITRLRRCTAGTTELSATVERLFPDLDTPSYLQFTGIKVNRMALSAKPREIAKATFSLISGREADEETTSLGAASATSGNSPCDALGGTWSIGGSASTVITGVDLTVENNEKPSEACGSTESAEVIPGRRIVTGTVTMYMQDYAAFTAWAAETEQELAFSTVDPDGNYYKWVCPRIKWEDVDAPKSDDGPIMLTAKFRALRDSTTGTNIYVERVDA